MDSTVQPTARQTPQQVPRCSRTSHSRLMALLKPLDTHLRHRLGVLEYTRSPQCILRIQLVPSDLDVLLSDGTHILSGDRIIDLHFWTEQVPALPKSGATLAWARRVTRSFEFSLCELAGFLRKRQEFDDVQAIRCNLPLGPTERRAQIARIMGRCGFEWFVARPPKSLAEKMRRLGENILISLLVAARNARAIRRDTLWRDRTLTYLSRRILERLYGAGREERLPSRLPSN